MARTLRQDLDDLHDAYVEQINFAVADDDVAAAYELARAYDDDAIVLVASWEDKSHLLPLQRRRQPQDSPLRRRVRQLFAARAA